MKTSPGKEHKWFKKEKCKGMTMKGVGGKRETLAVCRKPLKGQEGYVREKGLEKVFWLQQDMGKQRQKGSTEGS